MTDQTIYAGEDFALLLAAVADDGVTPEDLTDYDAVVQLFTSAISGKIVASTEDGSKIQIVRKDNSTLAVNIGHEFTANLSEGTLNLTVMLIHKQTKVQIIAQTKTLEVKKTKLQL